jgi:hypothetical protein
LDHHRGLEGAHLQHHEVGLSQRVALSVREAGVELVLEREEAAALALPLEQLLIVEALRVNGHAGPEAAGLHLRDYPGEHRAGRQKQS